MITHDLGVVAGLCDAVNVLYAGRVGGVGRAAARCSPTPPTRTRTGCSARSRAWTRPRGEPLNPIRGSVRDMLAWAEGCAFAPRCDRYTMACVDRHRRN